MFLHIHQIVSRPPLTGWFIEWFPLASLHALLRGDGMATGESRFGNFFGFLLSSLPTAVPAQNWILADCATLIYPPDCCHLGPDLSDK